MLAGAYGLVSSWRIPFLRQIRSNSTSAGHDLPNRLARFLAVTGPHLAGHPAGIAALALPGGSLTGTTLCVTGCDPDPVRLLPSTISVTAPGCRP